jgi:hypothetical protein
MALWGHDSRSAGHLPSGFMTDQPNAALRGVSAALRGLRMFLIGRDRPGTTSKRRVVTRVLASAGAVYLAYGASTYLDAKSGLPIWLCVPGGLALAVPLLLAVTRPLLAWRVAWVAAITTGAAVQVHHRTPFSWHPAFFVALIVLLCVVAFREPPTVTLWAWASLAALIALSFYPADRVPLIEIVTVPVAITALTGHRRSRAAERRRHRLERLPG